MDRAKLKEEAKKFINGKKLEIWKIFIVMCIPSFVSGFIAGLFGDSIITELVTTICSLAAVLFTFAGTTCLLKVVRGEKYDLNDIFNIVKDTSKWVPIFVTSLVVGLCTFAGSLLLVVPGIIMAISLTFYSEVLIDSNYKMGVKEVLQRCHEMMNGHKAEFFVLILSFAGWILLATLTCGILYIWLAPYMIVTELKYYDLIRK